MKGLATILLLLFIVATQSGCRSIASKLLRCEDTSCCSYILELQPPEHRKKKKAFTTNLREAVDSDGRKSNLKDLDISLSDIRLMSQGSSVGITNLGSEPLSFRLSNNLDANGKLYRPIHAKVRTETILVNKLPEEVRKMPVSMRLMPEERVLVRYTFPVSVAESRNFIQRIKVGEAPSKLIVSRDLILVEAAYNCLLGDGYGWRPVQGEIATDLSTYDEKEAKLEREQARASK